MKRPNFFIVGAPKCGTTALAHWLAQHPQVFFSARKEPHFFNVDGLTSTTTLREYEALFANATDSYPAVGEASTHYLYSREAVRRILEYQPEARFIVCLRNPLAMAPSLHKELLRQGYETERSFETAWRLQPARAAGYHLPRTVRGDPDRLQYGCYCKLGEQLQRLLSGAGRERVLPLVLDDTKRDPVGQYRRVLRFLGLEHDGRQQFDAMNPARHTRSPRVALLAREASSLKRRLGLTRQIGVMAVLDQLNTKVAKKEPLRQPVHAGLIEFFTEDVKKLESLLFRDLSSWLNNAHPV